MGYVLWSNWTAWWELKNSAERADTKRFLISLFFCCFVGLICVGLAKHFVWQGSNVPLCFPFFSLPTWCTLWRRHCHVRGMGGSFSILLLHRGDPQLSWLMNHGLVIRLFEILLLDILTWSKDVWIVWNTNFQTFKKKCPLGSVF